MRCKKEFYINLTLVVFVLFAFLIVIFGLTNLMEFIKIAVSKVLLGVIFFFGFFRLLNGA